MLHEQVVEPNPAPLAVLQEPKAWGLFRRELDTPGPDPEHMEFLMSGHTLETLKQWASLEWDGPLPHEWVKVVDGHTFPDWEVHTVYFAWVIREITCLP